MTTEAKFKYALKEMMLSLPLESINVTSLCEKCNCHRQTFYYHYQDIYDLIAAIFLNEDLDGLEKAKTAKDALYAFLNYCRENFVFLRSTYNSSAHDLPDDFIYGKLMSKFLTILSTERKANGLKLEECRTVARRYARIVSDEFGYCFKDVKLTPEKFAREMSAFIEQSLEVLLPVLMSMSKGDKHD